MRWDVFCRVVDNFGDIGVCWRLAADLAARGERVRLWADDVSALAWMAPHGAPGVSLQPWRVAASDAADALNCDLTPGDVVVEAFGCDPPEAFVRRMAMQATAPVWINLEYLSAEPAAERHHGLPSPQLAGPGQGLTKWFFYPGFTATTGGLIREPGLIAHQQRFDATSWLHRQGISVQHGERRISLFCYDNPALPSLLDELAEAPTLLLVAAGHAARQVQQELGPALARGALRAVLLPLLTQQDFDALLWSCDLNFVRGEDSFVRAQWAGRPFVWQIYPQHDGAHEAKLGAFLDRFLRLVPPNPTGADAFADNGVASDIRTLWRRWNGLSDADLALADPARWRRRCEAWRDSLLAQPDLTEQLIRFATEKRP
ncbi:MAG: hypothetical protein AD742_15965 [Methylibium sp. NZG]|nr:MAG: hypothetical protein AD742_15965 [Methylibium sp. NZG]